MKTFVIVNPHSGNGATGKHWPAMRTVIRHALGEFEEALTVGPGDATDLVRDALKSGFVRIIAVGGDGTNNEVVNGFFDGKQPIAPEAQLGFIPRGTGGDLRKTLKIDKSLDACLRVLSSGNVREVDVGATRFVDDDATTQERLFINITSFGLGGLVDATVNASSKMLGGKASFMLGTLRALMAYENKTIHLKVDDTFDETILINNVAVANGQYFGGGMWVAPEAKPDDGLFDVVILGNLSRSEIIRKTKCIYKGIHLRMPKVSFFRGKHVEATNDPDQEVLIDMDGEQPGRLPITLDVLPRALRIIAPPFVNQKS
jgi:YegS/Rv2252/BmrU family lipid kinase